MLPLPTLPKEDARTNTNTIEGISTEIKLLEVKDSPNSKALETIDEKENLKARLPLNALRNFAEAFNRVSSAYVEEIDDRTLLENAIKGMLSQLDPHSVYLDKNALSNLEEKTTGNYGGLGIEVTLDDGFVKVIAPMDGTPADKADIEAACFFYTQALVMALEENHDLKEKIIYKLEKYGRSKDETIN